MDAPCNIQGSIHVFHLIHKYVSRILGTYHVRSTGLGLFLKAGAAGGKEREDPGPPSGGREGVGLEKGEPFLVMGRGGNSVEKKKIKTFYGIY